MKTITNYDELLDYVNRLGFADSGNIAHRGARLCDAANLLCRAGGIGDGKWPEGATFDVRVSFFVGEKFRYPWMSTALVRRNDAAKSVWQVSFRYRSATHKWDEGDGEPSKLL